MKSLILSFFLFILSISIPSFASEIISSDDASHVNIAQVVSLVNLASYPKLQVNIAVMDYGGSTDASPTQRAFFTLYSKGEMFSADAAFDLGHIYALKSARRVGEGLYEYTVSEWNEATWGYIDVTYSIDASKAEADILKVDCGDEFDCSASENFQSTIIVTKK